MLAGNVAIPKVLAMFFVKKLLFLYEHICFWRPQGPSRPHDDRGAGASRDEQRRASRGRAEADKGDQRQAESNRDEQRREVGYKMQRIVKLADVLSSVTESPDTREVTCYAMKLQTPRLIEKEHPASRT